MRQEMKDASLFRVCQIIRALPGHRDYKDVVEFATNLLTQEEEPKPIVALFRLLEYVT